MENLPKNIFFLKNKGRNGTYVYQKRLNGKRWEWSRKDLEAILEVKKTVEAYYAEHGEVPKILDPRADIDYIKELPIGKKIGEWTILEHIPKNGRIYMKCKCSCGEIRQVYAPSLFKGVSMSCGHVFVEEMTTEDFQKTSKDLQRKRREPNIDNKLGERFISYNPQKRRYIFDIVRFGVKVRRAYRTFEEALEFKREILEAIDKNNGKIPIRYL